MSDFWVSVLKKLLPPEETLFYKYFEDGADVCKQVAELLHYTVHNNEDGKIDDETLVKARDLKHKSNALEKLVLNQLRSVFITPVDREDIQLIASLLNKIAKRIAKACLYLRTYRINSFNENIKRQSELIIKATDELKIVVSCLRNTNDIKKIADATHRMKELESQGDEILQRATSELFSGEFEALDVIKLQDVYKNIEHAMNTCFWVSDTVLNVTLKNS